MTSFCRVPYVSNMVSIRGMRVMLRVVGKLGRLYLFRHNFPNLNQYRYQMCIIHRNWIIVRTSPFLIFVSFADLLQLQLLVVLSRPLMWRYALLLRKKWQKSCSNLLFIIILQNVFSLLINHNLI